MTIKNTNNKKFETRAEYFYNHIQEENKIEIGNPTKIWFDVSKYNISDDVPCNVCNSRAVKIRLIKSQEQGGKNYFDNLIAVCNNCDLRADGLAHPYIDNKELTNSKERFDSERQEELRAL